MPKGSKKQKDKAADFSKARLKLGKGKKAPTNAVDTSFKARSIALPTQSILHPEDSEAPKTKRKLTFDDLLSQLRHYNAGTRKDAILGLRELLESYPGLINAKLTLLVTNIVRLIGDEDAYIRRTLLSFLSWLLPQISQEDLIPHSPILLLFTTSAQTHIFPEIRIDAIRFLDLFLEHIPDIVTDGWAQTSGGHGRRVLEGYLGVLNSGTVFGDGADKGPAQATSTASVVLSTASKLVVLKSLSIFLSSALSSSAAPTHAVPSSNSCTIPTWFLASVFSSVEAFDAFDSLLRPTIQSAGGNYNHGRWVEEVDVDTDLESFYGDFALATAPINENCTLQELSEIDVTMASSSATDTSAKTSFVAHLARALHSTLVSSFLDSAPAVFSPSSGSPETDLQMVLVVGEICRDLYGAILREPTDIVRLYDTSVEALKTMLGYFSPYFPFSAGGSVAAKRDVKVDQAFQDLNLIYCELTSYLELATPQDLNSRPSLQQKAHRPLSSEPAQAMRVSRVKNHVIQLLRGETAGTNSLGRSITPAAYSALLPTVWSLLNSEAGVKQSRGDGGTSESVLRVVVEHATKISSSSAVKRSTVDFLGRLVLLEREAEYLGALRVGQDSADDRTFEGWILHLAQTMWELGANNLPTTEAILRFLLRLCQRKSPLMHDKVLNSLCSRLIPYFVVDHPTRGKLPGPYSQLPSLPLRRLVLDVVATLIGSNRQQSDLEVAVRQAVGGTAETTYWMSIRSPL